MSTGTDNDNDDGAYDYHDHPGDHDHITTHDHHAAHHHDRNGSVIYHHNESTDDIERRVIHDDSESD
jgi:hypothetical protein